MRVAVKFFGSLREAVGAKELDVELPEGAMLSELRELLAERHPALEQLGERLAASVNLELAPLETALRDGDEVAFLPPVSGGSGLCSLSDRPLDEVCTPPVWLRETAANIAAVSTTRL